MINFQDIHIPDNRQRRHFDEEKLQELADSIEAKGLMHPIVLRNDRATLVSGERRLRAMILLHDAERTFCYNGYPVDDDEIPFTTLGDLSELELREAELEENVIREDLTMQERVAAIAALHALRGEQHPGQTFTDTASEIVGRRVSGGVHVARVSDAVTISKHLDNPEVAKAKTEKEALKIINKQFEQEIKRALAETADTSTSRHILEQCDARNGLADLGDSTVDVIITDPPYGIGADSFGDQSDGTHEYDDSEEYFRELMETLARQSVRITKPQAHLYLFCDPRWFNIIKFTFESVGWYVWRTPLIWAKGSQGILPRPDHGPRRTYEMILYAIRGDKPVTKVGMPDVIDLPATATTRRHAAEKPTSLYTNLLSRSCVPGDVILDPFCGSGPIFPAANLLELKAIGFELADNAYATAKLRMEETE